MNPITQPTPFYCPVCKAKDDAYYGRLVFPAETEKPTCPNHKEGVVIDLERVSVRPVNP